MGLSFFSTLSWSSLSKILFLVLLMMSLSSAGLFKQRFYFAESSLLAVFLTFHFDDYNATDVILNNAEYFSSRSQQQKFTWCGSYNKKDRVIDA
jgi:hypothetical protein